MRAAIICFTNQGAMTAQKIKKILEDQGVQAAAQCKKEGFQGIEGIEVLDGSLRQWTKTRFLCNDALIFVGAAGIAVRSIAPWLKSKVTDPAVIAVDEQGSFVISLVSGHIGGANELCESLAAGLGAVPVITTATDRNQAFAVDVFARKNGLWISDMKMAKMISAVVLDGNTVGFHSDVPVEGELPPELSMDGADGKEYGIDVSALVSRRRYPKTLHLVPKMAILGLGCRRGKGMEELEAFVIGLLDREGISLHAIEKVCSIDVKAQEKGILRFCEKYGLPFETYTPEQLRTASGNFASSDFVTEQVGVDNVCERSAVLGSDGGRLLVEKTVHNGMTAAVALRDWRIRFE